MITRTSLICFVLGLVLFSACATGKKNQPLKDAADTAASSYLPSVELQEQDGRQMLIGEVKYRDILYYFENWRETDQTIQPDESLVNRMQQVDEPVDVVCYLGTWCGDSRDGVPPFIRTLQAAANPRIQIKLIAVNRQKNEPESALNNDIERVPTFILKQNNEEFARMVEFPIQENFVIDFLTILGN